MLTTLFLDAISSLISDAYASYRTHFGSEHCNLMEIKYRPKLSSRKLFEGIRKLLRSFMAQSLGLILRYSIHFFYLLFSLLVLFFAMCRHSNSKFVSSFEPDLIFFKILTLLYHMTETVSTFSTFELLAGQ